MSLKINEEIVEKQFTIVEKLFLDKENIQIVDSKLEVKYPQIFMKLIQQDYNNNY